MTNASAEEAVPKDLGHFSLFYIWINPYSWDAMPGLCLTHLKCILTIFTDQHLWQGEHWNWGRDIPRHAHSPKIGAHKFGGLSDQATPPSLQETTTTTCIHISESQGHTIVYLFTRYERAWYPNILISKRQYPYTVTGKSLAHFFSIFFVSPLMEGILLPQGGHKKSRKNVQDFCPSLYSF